MNHSAVLERPGPNPTPAVDCSAIHHAIDHAAHYLPAQGPITAFVHHNTLHAFENLDFDSAVRKGAKLFGCHPYLPEKRYREMLISGRIRGGDVDIELADWLGARADDLLGFLGTRFGLYRAILRHALHDGASVDIRWVIGDTNALNRFRSDAPANLKKQFIADTRQWVLRDLRGWKEPSGSFFDASRTNVPMGLLTALQQIFELFKNGGVESWSDATWESFTLHLLWKTCEYGACEAGTADHSQKDIEPFVRPRDGLLELTCHDTDELTHELLIPFCSAFLDQGFSNWPLARREAGFFSSFLDIYETSRGWVEPWRRDLSGQLQLHKHLGTAIQSIQYSIREFGVKSEDLEPFITQTLLSLRGFAGMLWQLETRADRANRGMPQGTLLEFLAIKLILDRMAALYVARNQANYGGNLNQLSQWVTSQIENRQRPGEVQLRNAYRVFELAQLLNWRPRFLTTQSPAEWNMILAELNRFSGVDRRQIYHLAFERKYRIETLDAARTHALRSQIQPDLSEPGSPDFQIVCCIDEREESFRRHLEEVSPGCKTYGAAGFFSVPMYYRGAADAHFTPLCPVIIQPDNHVREEAVYSLRRHDDQRKKARRTIGTVTHRVHIGSRTLTGGWIGTALLGSLATIPLVARILFPRLTSRFRKLIGGFVKTPEVTRLQLERSPRFPPGPDNDQLGFTVEEMADSVERLLHDIGARDFSRLFIICGHGSASLNNPHESAHDCGACAGGRGGPNARAFAQMANDNRVRRIVAERGIVIPEVSWFVGCYHNTCDDSVTYYDLDQVPKSHQAEFEQAMDAIDEARKRDAHERCRRFESAPLDLSYDEALKHVEARAEDLSQVRPEYGHATNALCFVGRRAWSRGLFLDRRAFLQSYDPKQDDEKSTILERVLQAVIPVCAGINLEYYFSFVDPTGYGCGTKLPHNITSLLGVMNGAGSDLRPGLPWQMVEIHEPVRLLFLIETTTAAMHRIISCNDQIKKLCQGDWVQLAVFDSERADVQLYRRGIFEPYNPETTVLDQVSSSGDWYRGLREHLGFATISTEFEVQKNGS